MKTLEKGKDKIDKICALLRNETLEPAQKEAAKIIEDAKEMADQIIADAQKAAERLQRSAKAAIDQEHLVFQSSLQQAAKQFLEALRQSIENKVFNEHLLTLIEKGAADPGLMANLLNALAKAIEKEGLSTDLTAVVAKTIVPRQLNELLLSEFLKSLKGGSVVLGDFSAGIKLKINDKRMTVDISEQALKELLAAYVVRKDFRKIVFNN